jgi:small-conductance mechanosensitive channel
VWQASIVVAFIALAMTVAGLAMRQANAQEPAAAPAASPAAEPSATPAAESKPAPEETLLSGDKEIAEFAASLDLWAKQIKLIAETIANDQTQDAELRDVSSQLAELRTLLVDGRDRLKPKLDKLRDLLKELGPAPDETKPEESPQTALQRQKLSAAVVAVDGLLKRADVLLVATDQLTDAANEKRHSASPSPCSVRCRGCSSTFCPGPSKACRFKRSRCWARSAPGSSSPTARERCW